MSETAVVQRDQCRGRQPYRCVNCDRPLGERHDILCYTFALARKAEGRESAQ